MDRYAENKHFCIDVYDSYGSYDIMHLLIRPKKQKYNKSIGAAQLTQLNDDFVLLCLGDIIT